MSHETASTTVLLCCCRQRVLKSEVPTASIVVVSIVGLVQPGFFTPTRTKFLGLTA